MSSSRLSQSGQRPLSERISIFEQRQTTTTTTSITSHGIDRSETTTRSTATRVSSPGPRTFSSKNFDDLKSAFSSPQQQQQQVEASPRSAPSPIRIPGASPTKAVGSRTSVPLSPTQPATPPPLEVFNPTTPQQTPPVVQQRSSASLNVDKTPSSAAPLKSPLKKTNSPSSAGKTKTGSSSSAASSRGGSVKSAKSGASPSAAPASQRGGSSGKTGGNTPAAGRTTPSSGRQVVGKASTTPIKPVAAAAGPSSPGAMNINTVTINVKKTTVSELNGSEPRNSTTTTTTKVVRDRAVTAPIPIKSPPTVVVTMDQHPKTLQHSQSLVKIGGGGADVNKSINDKVETKSEKEEKNNEVVKKADERQEEDHEEVSEVVQQQQSSKTEEEMEVEEEEVSLLSKPTPAVINAPKPIIEEEDDMSDEQPRSPSPVRNHQPLKKTSAASVKSNLNHKDSTADFVDSIVNNKNRINTHNLVGNSAEHDCVSDNNSFTPKPSSTTTTVGSALLGPGSSPTYWADQALQNDNSRKILEVFVPTTYLACPFPHHPSTVLAASCCPHSLHRFAALIL